MTIERRRPEASGLRRLFQEQLDHVTGLIDGYNERRRQSREERATELRAVESVVEGTNGRMRLVGNYKNRLRDGVRALLQHVDALVAQLPGPVDADPRHFFEDPRLNAFFVNRGDIENLFSRAHCLQDFFAAAPGCEPSRAHAVLFMTKVERTVLGMDLLGGVLTRDVKQTTVSFTNHTLVEPRESEEESRMALKTFLFDSFVEYVKYRLVRLSVTDDGPDLKNPAVYLQELMRILGNPETLLKLDSYVIRVNRIGIKVPEGSREPSHEIRLHELGLGTSAHEVVTLVSYPKAHMLPANSFLDEVHARMGAF